MHLIYFLDMVTRPKSPNNSKYSLILQLSIPSAYKLLEVPYLTTTRISSTFTRPALSRYCLLTATKKTGAEPTPSLLTSTLPSCAPATCRPPASSGDTAAVAPPSQTCQSRGAGDAPRRPLIANVSDVGCIQYGKQATAVVAEAARSAEVLWECCLGSKRSTSFSGSRWCQLRCGRSGRARSLA